MDEQTREATRQFINAAKAKLPDLAVASLKDAFQQLPESVRWTRAGGRTLTALSQIEFALQGLQVECQR